MVTHNRLGHHNNKKRSVLKKKRYASWQRKIECNVREKAALNKLRREATTLHRDRVHTIHK